jgi:putative hydrolase of the HAD superfamily
LQGPANRRTVRACEGNPDATQHREISAETIFGSILEAWGLDPAQHSGAAIEAFFSFFQQRLSAYPETVSVLQTLRTHHIPTGILTDVAYGMPRAFVERDIAGAGITGLFDVLLSSVEVGVRKPEPTGYHELAKRLGVASDEMFYVGNEAKDIIGAKQAGACSVFLDRNHTGADHGQDFTAATLTDLYEILSLNVKPK